MEIDDRLQLTDHKRANFNKDLGSPCVNCKDEQQYLKSPEQTVWDTSLEKSLFVLQVIHAEKLWFMENQFLLQPQVDSPVWSAVKLLKVSSQITRPGQLYNKQLMTLEGLHWPGTWKRRFSTFGSWPLRNKNALDPFPAIRIGSTKQHLLRNRNETPFQARYVRAKTTVEPGRTYHRPRWMLALSWLDGSMRSWFTQLSSYLL